MKKKKRLLLFIPLLLGLLGCGQDKMELLKEVKEELAQEQDNILGITKTDGGLTVTLNQIAFEEDVVVLDYTVKSEELTHYADVIPKIKKDGKEKTGGNETDLDYKNQREKNYIMFFEGSELKFSKEDIGEEVEVQFTSVNIMSDVDITFPVKIKRIYETEVIPVDKKLEYKDEFITIDYIERSQFYTALYIKYKMDESMADLCWPRITDSNNKEVLLFNGDLERFFYERLEDDCKKVNISMVQYEDENRIKTISESLEIELN